MTPSRFRVTLADENREAPARSPVVETAGR